MIDPDSPGPGILTERDLLESIGAGQDPDTELVADHLTSDLVFAAPDWSLEEAAVAMVRGGFRHLVVVEGGEIAGVLSMRDVVRCWTEDGAICDVPASAPFAPPRRPAGRLPSTSAGRRLLVSGLGERAEHRPVDVLPTPFCRGYCGL